MVSTMDKYFGGSGSVQYQRARLTYFFVQSLAVASNLGLSFLRSYNHGEMSARVNLDMGGYKYRNRLPAKPLVAESIASVESRLYPRRSHPERKAKACLHFAESTQETCTYLSNVRLVRVVGTWVVQFLLDDGKNCASALIVRT